MPISETVLEMHYHQPLMDLFRKCYGLTPTGSINFYKYCPQRETFLGFDQAFAMTEMTDEEFFDQLKSCAMNNGYKLSSRFVAYFLQYKVVSQLQRQQKKTPLQVKSTPHYRASLDTTKNDNTGFSQHELLYNLNKNDGAMVYYACPMVFEKTDLYQVDVDLDNLRLVDVTSCPSDFTDNSKHYIYFDKQQSEPIWCSEPVEGKAINPMQFVSSVLTQLQKLSPKDSADKLSVLLSHIKERSSGEKVLQNTDDNFKKGFSLFADSLTIIRLDEEIRDI